MYNMCIFGINPEYFWLLDSRESPLQITLYYYITHVFRIFDFDLKLAQISARVTTCNIGRHYTLVTHFAIIAHLPPPVACLPVSYMYIKMYIKRSQNGIFLQMIRRSVWTPIYWLSISECRRWYIFKGLGKFEGKILDSMKKKCSIAAQVSLCFLLYLWWPTCLVWLAPGFWMTAGQEA